MKVLPFIYLLLLLMSGCSSKKEPAHIFASQVSYKDSSTVYEKIERADSVILISHVLTKEYAIRPVHDNETGKPATLPKEEAPSFLLQNGTVNPAIIQQQRKINQMAMEVLSAIFGNSIEKEEVNQIKCDMPHHSILLYEHTQQSYIDICFDCERIHCSPDIILSEKDFDANKWIRLKSFFLDHGLTYALNREQ